MTFRQLSVITLLLTLVVFAACAQTSTPPPPQITSTQDIGTPTYVLFGGQYTPTQTQRWNLMASMIYAAPNNPVVEYLASTANIVPVKQVNPATGKSYYSFQVLVTETVHKMVWHNSAKTMFLLVGPGAGGAFSQASPGGTNVNVAASLTATPVFKLGKSNFGLALPIQGLYSPQIGWTLSPSIALVYKP